MKRNHSLAESDLKFKGLSDQLKDIREEMATLKSDAANKKQVMQPQENRLGCIQNVFKCT